MAFLTKNQLFTLSERSSVKAFSVNESINRNTASTTVFLSHKHSDINEVKRLKRLLLTFKTNIYIDWLDPDMPKETRGETAIKIKQKIKDNKKFVLLATDDAVNSKWCNWELGFGDGEKFNSDDLAIFPLQDDNKAWSGSEYMQIYPTIEYLDGTIKNNLGNLIPSGYYVLYPNSGTGRPYKTFSSWLSL